LVPTSQGRIYSTLLFSDFVKEKKWHIYIYHIYIYIYMITQIGSPPLFFFFLLYSPSYGDFKRFKNSIFILK
jgi:hypothetical protein